MTIEAAPFGTLKTGETVTAYTLCGRGGMAVRVLDYGATVQSILVPDRAGRPVDVVLGYDDIAGYEAGSCWFGATVGRYANRIGGSAFTLNGTTYRLPKNEGENHLHGTFERRLFAAEPGEDALLLHLTSPDGEDSFPGTVRLTVTVRVTDDNALSFSWRAVTDADTHINITNHSYFNLAGGGDILGHRLRLAASRFTEADAQTLPTGRVLPVEGTALDFRTEKTIGRDLFSGDPLLVPVPGYDHNYVLDKGPGFALCGEAFCPETGIVMAFSTTQPGVQFYCGCFVDGDAAPRGKNGVRYPRYGGFCLESQHYPDSPNRPSFPSTLLRPGEEYDERTEYRFLVR